MVPVFLVNLIRFNKEFERTKAIISLEMLLEFRFIKIHQDSFFLIIRQEKHHGLSSNTRKSSTNFCRQIC